MTWEKFFIRWLLKEFKRKRSTDRRNKITCSYCVQKYFGFQKRDVGRRKNKHNFEIAQLKTRLKSEALCQFLGRYLENKTMNYTNTNIWSWYSLKRSNGDENDSLNICIKMISGFKAIILWTIAQAYGGSADQITLENLEIFCGKCSLSKTFELSSHMLGLIENNVRS